MKRFFCTTCQRVRRSRRLPDDCNMDEHLQVRTGTCVWHNPGIPRVRARVKRVNVKRTKSPQVPSPPKKQRASR